MNIENELKATAQEIQSLAEAGVKSGPVLTSLLDRFDSLEQQKNDAYSRVWLEYTRAEFFDAIEEFMKRGPGYEDSEKELARVAACLRFINSKIPGATAPYC